MCTEVFGNGGIREQEMESQAQAAKKKKSRRRGRGVSGRSGPLLEQVREVSRKSPDPSRKYGKEGERDRQGKKKEEAARGAPS